MLYACCPPSVCTSRCALCSACMHIWHIIHDVVHFVCELMHNTCRHTASATRTQNMRRAPVNQSLRSAGTRVCAHNCTLFHIIRVLCLRACMYSHTCSHIMIVTARIGTQHKKKTSVRSAAQPLCCRGACAASLLRQATKRTMASKLAIIVFREV